MSSKAAMAEEWTRSNPGLHWCSDSPGFRSSWGLPKPKKNQRWIPELLVLESTSNLWKATILLCLLQESLDHAIRISIWSLICHASRPDPRQSWLWPQLVPSHAPGCMKPWQHLPSLYSGLPSNQPVSSASVGKLLSCLSCSSNWFTKFKMIIDSPLPHRGDFETNKAHGVIYTDIRKERSSLLKCSSRAPIY